jgi:acetyltransferase-like isoleucine patch superfamily enzyme
MPEATPSSVARLVRGFERGVSRGLLLADPVWVPLREHGSRVAGHMRQERLNRRFRSCGRDVNILEPDLILGHEFIDVGGGVNVHPRCRWEVIWRGEGSPHPSLEIGERMNAGFNFTIGCSERVTIGSHVLIANNVLITDSVHNYEDTASPIMLQGVRTGGPVVLEDGCWIGFGAIVLPGVVVGTQSVIGGGSVVTESVPPFSVAVGNPARVVREYVPETREWKPVA